MAANPLDSFSTPQSSADDWDSISTPVLREPASGQQPAPNALPQNQIDFEIEQMLRQGRSPAEVQQYLGTVVAAETGTPITISDPRELEAASAYYKSGGKEPVQFNRQLLGPDGTPSTQAGAFARGAGDAVTLNYLDELQAFLATGKLTGPEFEEAWQRQQQRRAADDPTSRGFGQAAGTLATMAFPYVAAGKYAGLGLQSAAQAGVGATMSAMSGIGVAAPGERFDTVVPDALIGGIFGAATPLAASIGRSATQAALGGGRSVLAGGAIGATGGGVVGAANPDENQSTLGAGLQGAAVGGITGGAAGAGVSLGRFLVGKRGQDFIDQSAADDALRQAGLDVNEMKRMAQQIWDEQGRGASVAELISLTQGKKLAGPLSRSEDAAERARVEYEAKLEQLQTEIRGKVTAPGQTGDRRPVAPGQKLPNQAAIDADEARRRVDDYVASKLGPIRGTEVPVNPAMRVFLTEKVMPFANNLAPITQQRLKVAIQEGQPLTVEDFDHIRRALDVDASIPGAKKDHKKLQEDLESYVTQAVPEYGKTLSDMRRLLSAVDGANPNYTGGLELGEKILTTGTEAFRNAATRQTEEKAIGLAVGARRAIADEAVESPEQAYRFADKLTRSVGLKERLYAALPKDEADSLIAFVTLQKQGIDALSGLSGIPVQKLLSVEDAVETATQVSALPRAGAGFMANVASRITERTGIGSGPADKLAEDLFNPERRERVFKMLESAGLPRRGVREIVQSAMIAYGVSLTVGQRSSGEGVPPTESLTVEVPQ